ncbi:MAG: uracil phosphoribosyltransferase [Alphaproteobacteria bacterium]|nr:uracil phosphoribosyltransferase [Alphaproteobacteria bacterium]
MYQHSAYPQFHVVDHPLILNKLTQMREVGCAAFGFRTLLREISLLIGYEITRGMALTKRAIMTPMAAMQAPTLADPAPCIVPVLRAGLGMAEGLLDLMPTAQVGHIGLYRDHDSKKPVEYLNRLPTNQGQWFFVADPMLATGNSLVHACTVLRQHGVAAEKIRVMSLVAAPEGLQNFFAQFPDIRVYGAALDDRLDANAYIIPGLGDAGDRMFGTV